MCSLHKHLPASIWSSKMTKTEYRYSCELTISYVRRWGRRFRERDGSTTSRQQNNQQEQQIQLPTEPRPTPKPSMTMLEAPSTRKAPRREMRRTLSKADLCAVCLDEVRERHQRVTRLPCSHKYHSECVLPWLAIQPDCPCCRTQVPSVDSLFVVWSACWKIWHLLPLHSFRKKGTKRKGFHCLQQNMNWHRHHDKVLFFSFLFF